MPADGQGDLAGLILLRERVTRTGKSSGLGASSAYALSKTCCRKPELQILVPIEDGPGGILHEQGPTGYACPVLRKPDSDSDLGRIMDTPSNALTRGLEARTLMLEKQNRLTASGNSGGHAYLLIPNRQGGFARIGFWLDDGEQRILIPWGDT